jgi:hypothetical protein
MLYALKLAVGITILMHLFSLLLSSFDFPIFDELFCFEICPLLYYCCCCWWEEFDLLFGFSIESFFTLSTIFYLSFAFDLGSLGVFTVFTVFTVTEELGLVVRLLMFFVLWLLDIGLSIRTDSAILTFVSSEVNCDTFLLVFFARVILLKDALLSLLQSFFV